MEENDPSYQHNQIVSLWKVALRDDTREAGVVQRNLCGPVVISVVGWTQAFGYTMLSHSLLAAGVPCFASFQLCLSKVPMIRTELLECSGSVIRRTCNDASTNHDMHDRPDAHVTHPPFSPTALASDLQTAHQGATHHQNSLLELRCANCASTHHIQSIDIILSLIHHNPSGTVPCATYC